MNRLPALACALGSAVLLFTADVIAADPPKAKTKAVAKRATGACDTTKVFTGPRGGKYRYSANCRKVYLRR